MKKSKNKIELCPRMRMSINNRYTKNKVLKFSSYFLLLTAAVLTLNSFWIIKKTSSRTPIELNQNAPQVLGATDTKNPDPGNLYIEYKIKKGDTLFNLSQEYNVNWMTLATLNNLKSPFSVKPGQTIKIPK